MDQIPVSTVMQKCSLCPRNCRVHRENAAVGYCGETAVVRVARISLHMWEEPCISGKNGSGTIFFSGCPLRCVFCQNKSIALGNKGEALTSEELCRAFLLLQEKNAENINLVTPTHFAPQIAKAIEDAKARGLRLPIVYNTAGYERVETLKMLDGLVDIYLPDMKYQSDAVSLRYSNAPDYFEYAADAIAEMVRQTKNPVFEKGLMKRGTIVRHMVLPGHTKDSINIIRYLYETFRDTIYISIMNQYTPPQDIEERGFSELSRRVTKREYEKVINEALRLDVVNAFIQEGETASESFIPDFDDMALLTEIRKKRS
ncbi:radical SAM protein [Lachnospiraceae bacterium MD335]|nr:radical SAM protein [Lachnospiraceae bacterium MD335]